MCTKKFHVKSPRSEIEITRYLTLLPFDQIHLASKYRKNVVLDRQDDSDLVKIYFECGGVDMWGNSWELISE